MANLRLLGTLLAVVLVTALLAHLWQSQLVAPEGAIESGFDEAHAYATLSKIWAEQKPHSSGTAENAVIRDRLIEELKAAGYQPEIQKDIVCGPAERNSGCTAVENIIAVHKGASGGKAVLATAHYDSVPAGPGVSDDGGGAVIVVELARYYANKQTKNDIIFLITDGEETGLRGAMAFAQKHPLMASVGIVVNVEARGASGPSMMFETGVGNSKLMDIFASTVARPSANSVTYEVYRLMPNDTDFSVYRRLGLTGFNFAYSNSGSLYHSARDDLKFISRQSLQHQGEHAFEVTSVLADADLAALKSTSDASYFDIFGWTMVIWPSALNLPLAVFALVAILGLMVMHRAAFTFSGTFWAIGAFLAVPVLLFAIGWLLSYPLGIWPGVHPIDHPFPWMARVAILSAGLLVAFVVAATVRSRADMRAVLLVNWLLLAVIATAAAYYVTGASFPTLLPAVAFGVVAWGETLLKRQALAASAWVGLLGLLFFLIGFVFALELVLSFSLTQYKILVLMPIVLALVPVLMWAIGERPVQMWLAGAVAAPLILGAAIGANSPAYTSDHPRGLNVVYYDDKAAKPRWYIGFLGAADEAYLKAQGFPAKDEEFKPLGLLGTDHGRFKPATDLQMLAPGLSFVTGEGQSGDPRVTSHTNLSAPGSFLMGLVIPPHSGIRSIAYQGQELVSAERLASDDPVRVAFWGLWTVALDFTYEGSPPKIVLFAVSRLPESADGRALIDARPSDATQVYRGDSATVFTTIDLVTLKSP